MRTSESPDAGGMTGFGDRKPFHRRFSFWVWVIIGVAVLLRLWSINHGLPHSYYADEEHFVKRSLSFGSGDLNPHWFHKPAFFMYVLFFEYGFYFLTGKVMGWWGSPTEFAYHFFDNAGMFFLLGRITATLSGIGVVVLAVFCGRRLGGSGCGIIAGLMLATNFCMAEAGRWVKADIPCTFFTMLAAYWCIRITEEGRRKHYWLAGAAIGIGIATKYYALTLVPSLWFVHWLGGRGGSSTRRRFFLNPRPWEAMAVVFLAFFLCSPFNILDFDKWWELNLSSRFDHIWNEKLGLSMLSFGIVQPLNFQVGALSLFRCLLSPECMGGLWGSLAVLGMVFQLVSGRRTAWVPFLVILPFTIVAILWNPIHFEPRYLTAILPLLAISAAHLVIALWSGVQRRVAWIPAWVGIAALMGAMVPGTLLIIDWNQRHMRKDTRTITARWIETHIPAGTRIINDNDWVKLRKNEESLKLEWEIIKAQRQKYKDKSGAFLTSSKDYQYEYSMAASRIAEERGEPTYTIYTLNHPWWSEREDSEGDLGRHEIGRDMGTPLPRRPLAPEELSAWKAEYIVTTAKTYCDYRPGGRFGHFKNWVQFYQWVARLPLVYTIPYQPEVRSGPTVRIYAVTEDGLRQAKLWLKQQNKR